MRKYILSLIVFLYMCSLAGAWGVSLDSDSGSPASSCDTSNITFWWRCEAFDFSGTNGTLDYSAGDDSATLNGSPTIEVGAAKYGTNGYNSNSQWEHVYFTTVDATMDDEGRLGMWIRIDTFLDDYVLLWMNGNGSNKIQVRLDGTEELHFRWIDSGSTRTQLTTTTADLAASTWYFIEAAWKTSTNYREIFVGGVSKGSSSATISSLAVAVGNIYIGDAEVGSSNDVDIDNYIISTDSTVDLFTDCKDELEWPE